jgi:hypothetical protein
MEESVQPAMRGSYRGEATLPLQALGRNVRRIAGELDAVM